jgi:hypothetical protein
MQSLHVLAWLHLRRGQCDCWESSAGYGPGLHAAMALLERLSHGLCSRGGSGVQQL